MSFSRTSQVVAMRDSYWIFSGMTLQSGRVPETLNYQIARRQLNGVASAEEAEGNGL
jgi:hypothetical protein